MLSYFSVVCIFNVNWAIFLCRKNLTHSIKRQIIIPDLMNGIYQKSLVVVTIAIINMLSIVDKIIEHSIGTMWWHILPFRDTLELRNLVLNHCEDFLLVVDYFPQCHLGTESFASFVRTSQGAVWEVLSVSSNKERLQTSSGGAFRSRGLRTTVQIWRP